MAADPVTDYARRVVNGEELAGALHLAACRRHLDDLARGEDFPYVFDRRKADFVCSLIELLPQFEGKFAGKPLKLEPFQVFMVGSMFGWVHRETGLRRFRQVYIEMPRKNGKSTLCGALALVLAFFDNEAGAQVYCAATKRDQAKITWNVAAEMVKGSSLKSRIDVRVANMNDPASASKLEPLGGDTDSLDGLNIHGAILDEIHKYKSSEMIDVIVTATGAREQPLIVEITTAGIGQLGPCWDHHEYTSKVARGVVTDDTWFGVIFAADPEDDWTQETTWRKANPNYGVSINPEDIARKAKQAEHIPAFESEFRRLHLGQWVQQAEKYLSLVAWDDKACAEPFDAATMLAKKPCVVGMDVGSRDDLAAVVALFEHGGVSWAVPHFFAPASVLDGARKHLVPYEVWARQGYLTLTPGNTIDQKAIRAHVVAWSKTYRVLEVAFDAWNATALAGELQDDGLEVVEVRQGFRSLSEPTKDLAALVADRKLRHGGNPILRWMADNLVVRTDPNGNVAPDKARASEKIDGIVALIMALSRRGKLRAAKPARSGLLVIGRR